MSDVTMPDEIMAWMGFQDNGSWDTTAPDYLNAIPYVRKDRTPMCTDGDLAETLREAEEYFDQRADAEYFTDSPSPLPNEEMRLLVKVRDALRLIDAKQGGK